MSDPNLLEIEKREVHWLPTCPCACCEVERKKREAPPDPTNRIRRIPVSAAQALGIIPISPGGSYASQIRLRVASSNGV